MTENILKLNDVSFSYGKIPVLRDISLEVNRGEVLGILGPNGAGKSTLIKLMAGILAAKSGGITVRGKGIHTMNARERAQNIAVVPQVNLIPFAFTSMEVVLMGRASRLPVFGFESKRDIEIAEEAMRRTDCIEFAPRAIGALSGGERQRVILARAFAQETPVVLLDEPTTFLDIRHQIELHKFLTEQNAAKKLTIISAMHDLNLAAAFCHRVVLIKDGRILADGSPAEIMTPENIQNVFGVKASDLSILPLYSREMRCY